ncbi:CBASS cGAMP-activated phospholipase [Hyphomicrobium sp. B1]|uniref:CBASS cGAMP-activated phospholipase n=1 Tax=unclassified Hyphomicrobium TaxID=2619925 RepID=UPI001E03FE77|nr:patatin-like phospholipase family protein [Pseudomonadota bacterium]
MSAENLDPLPIRRILCLDGGGIMGTLPASFLAAIERNLDRPIGEYFDLIAGTSTGGILAIGLGLGLSAQQLLDLYVDRGPFIFGEGTSGLEGFISRLGRKIKHWVATKHDATALRRELDAILGQRQLGESRTRLLIPSWDPLHRSVYIFKTAHHDRLKTDYSRLAVDAAMATAAAPTIFRRHTTADHVGLFDGGVWANNPIALAVVEAISILGWPSSSLRILSLGCVNEVYALGAAPGKIGIIRDLSRLFMDGQSRGALGIAKLLTGHEHEREAIFRVCPDVPKDLYAMDDTRKISELRGMGAAAARKECPRLEPIFFQAPAESFEPIHKLKGTLT